MLETCRDALDDLPYHSYLMNMELKELHAVFVNNSEKQLSAGERFDEVYDVLLIKIEAAFDEATKDAFSSLYFALSDVERKTRDFKLPKRTSAEFHPYADEQTYHKVAELAGQTEVLKDEISKFERHLITFQTK